MVTETRTIVDEYHQDTIQQLQQDIQQYPFIPSDQRMEANERIQSLFKQAEINVKRFPDKDKYKCDIDRIKALMTLYMSDQPRPIMLKDNNTESDHQSISINEDSRERLLQNNLIGEADNKIMETQRLANEAEQVGHSTLNDLKRQREQLERARRQLLQTDVDLDTSNSLMAIMRRRYCFFD